MRVEQLIYTSCPKGLGDGPGFQVQAVSPGLSPEDRAELEKVPLPKRPAGLSPKPTPAEIAAVVPVGLFGRRLSSGRLAVTRRAYVGADYSDRPGNSVLHSLVFDPAPPFPPTRLAAWDGWHAAAADEPPALRSLGPADFKSLSGPSAARAFVAADPSRVATVAALVDALLTDGDAPVPRGVAVRAAAADVGAWVAAVLEALPFTFEPPLTFLTFADDTLPKADVRGITADAASTMEASGVRVLDVAAAVAGAKGPEAAVAETLARLLAAPGDGPADLAGFAAGFAPPARASAVAGLVDAWMFATGARVPRTTDALARALGAAAAHLKHPKAVAARLVAAVNRLDLGTLRSIGAPALAAPLADLAKGAADPALAAAVRACLTRLTWATIEGAGPWQDVAAAADALSPAADRPAARVDAVDAAITAGLPERVAPDAKALEAALDYVDTASGSSAKGAAWQSDLMRRFVAAIAQAGGTADPMATVLKRAVRDATPEAIADLCRRVLAPPRAAAGGASSPAVANGRAADLGGALGRALGPDIASERAADVRAALLDLGLGDLVCHEIRSRVHGAPVDDAIAVLGSLDGRELTPAALAGLGDPLSEITRDLPPKDRLTLAEWLLKRPVWLKHLDPAARQAVLVTIDASLKLDPADERSLRYAEQIADLGGVDACERVQLRLTIDELKTKEGRKRPLAGPDGWARRLAKAVVPPPLAADFAGAVLPTLVNRCESHAELHAVLTGLIDAATPDAVAGQLRRLIRRSGGPDALSALGVALLVVAWVSGRGGAGKPLRPGNPGLLPAPVQAALDAEVERRLAALSIGDFNQVNDLVCGQSAYKKKSGMPLVDWTDLRGQIERRRDSTVNRVLRIVTGPLRLVGWLKGRS